MAAQLKSRTSWRAKLEKPREAKVVPVPPRMRKSCGTGLMLIPRPLDVDALIREVPRGKLVTINQLRALLARQNDADVTCPLVTGILVRIAAEAAEEDARAGRKRITPYWRVLREGGRCNEKYPGGVAAQAAHLEAEGHTVEAGRVRNFEKRLVAW
ncbi:MAG: MGMT family protein [Acidobacteria bacterium]|nr:MGMT family protein [Acidobacteriota bacterium]